VPPQKAYEYAFTTTTTTTTREFDFENNITSLICDDDIGGPNCPHFTGPIAVYRFSFAMVMFFGIFSIFTLGVSNSRSIRAHIHNGFWLWKILFALFLISVSFKLPFFGLLKTSNTLFFSQSIFELI